MYFAFNKYFQLLVCYRNNHTCNIDFFVSLDNKLLKTPFTSMIVFFGLKRIVGVISNAVSVISVFQVLGLLSLTLLLVILVVSGDQGLVRDQVLT